MLENVLESLLSAQNDWAHCSHNDSLLPSREFSKKYRNKYFSSWEEGL